MVQLAHFKADLVCFHSANDICILYIYSILYIYIYACVSYSVPFATFVFRGSSCFRFSKNLGGANAMVKSAATYAGIAYMTELLLPSNPKKSQFEFTDYDLPEETNE